MKLFNLIKIAIKLKLPAIKVEKIIEEYEVPAHMLLHHRHLKKEKKEKTHDNINRSEL